MTSTTDSPLQEVQQAASHSHRSRAVAFDSHGAVPTAAMSFRKYVRRAGCLMVLGISVVIAGCGKQMPECGSSDTVALVKQIFWETIEGQPKYSAADPNWFEKAKKLAAVNVASIRTTATDEKVGRVACQATLEVQMPGGMRNHLRTLATLGKVKLKDDTVSTDVEFNSQLTDDKKEHLVEMTGHVPLTNVVGDAARSTAFMQVTATSPTPVAAPTTTPAPAVAAPAPQMQAQGQSTRATRTERDVSVIWLECGDLCHLQYKTAQGEVKSALCVEAAVCQQWTQDPSSFKKHVGSNATLTLGSKFVPEGGETVDSVQGLEWR